MLKKSRSPLAQLLHALNQPLTGLQCSLELAVAGPRPADQYLRTLREGLELVARMRILVEALREVADSEASPGKEPAPLLLDALLQETVDDLLPVAKNGNVHISLVRSGPLPVRADRGALAALTFRWLECALSLAREGSDLHVVAVPESEYARLAISFTPGPPPEHSPFSRRELGMMIARAGWERAGAVWADTLADSTRTCTVQLPLASPILGLQSCGFGDPK
jgi:hypothetical protein